MDMFSCRNNAVLDFSVISFLSFSEYYMPRGRSQYIAEMRERFEVVDRVKASAEEKASLTKAIQQEDSDPSSAEVSPSKVWKNQLWSFKLLRTGCIFHPPLFGNSVF